MLAAASILFKPRSVKTEAAPKVVANVLKLPVPAVVSSSFITIFLLEKFVVAPSNTLLAPSKKAETLVDALLRIASFPRAAVDPVAKLKSLSGSPSPVVST